MSRYYVAGEAIRGAALFSERSTLRTMELGGELQGRIKCGREYIFEYGIGESCRVIPKPVCSRMCFHIDPAAAYDFSAFD